MNRNEIEELCTSLLTPLQEQMNIADWKIDLSFDTDEFPGVCKPTPGYNYAEINVDISRHDDMEDIYKTLVHELSHVICGNFETYRKMVCQLIDDKMFFSMDEMYKVAHEDAARRIEFIIQNNMSEKVKDILSGDKKDPVPFLRINRDLVDKISSERLNKLDEDEVGQFPSTGIELVDLVDAVKVMNEPPE